MGFERSVFFWGGVSLPLGRWTLIQSYGNGSFRPSSITCNLWTMASQAFVNPVWGLRVVWSIRQWFPAFFLFGTVVWSIRSEGCLVVCFFHAHVLVGQVRPKKHVNRTRRGQRVREWLPCAVHRDKWCLVMVVQRLRRCQLEWWKQKGFSNDSSENWNSVAKQEFRNLTTI